MANETRVIIENARLGADPERKTGKNSGQPYVSLRFATTPYRKNKQTGQYENLETEWWSAVEFDERQMQTYLEQLHKGDSIRVEGVLTLGVYTDKDGHPQIDRQVSWARISKNLPKAKQEQQGFQQSAQQYQPQTGFSNQNPFNGVPASQGPQQYPQQPSEPWAQGYDGGFV